MTLCECGCGKEVKPGNRFIHGHNGRGILRSQKICAAISKGLKNSDVAKAKSEARRGVPRSPEACAAISKGKLGIPQTSPAQISGHKSHGDKQRGGNDICKHHYIYDHDDLSKNTIGMTRSDHSKLHCLLRKLGYIVPHINMKEI